MLSRLTYMQSLFLTSGQSRFLLNSTLGNVEVRNNCGGYNLKDVARHTVANGALVARHNLANGGLAARHTPANSDLVARHTLAKGALVFTNQGGQKFAEG